MKLNKNTSFVLMHLLGGATAAVEIAERMLTVSLRSIQRALVRLSEAGLIQRHGLTDPRYSINYERILQQQINTNLFEDINRPETSFNFGLVDWLSTNGPQALVSVLPDKELPLAKPQKMTNRELEHLTVELSWKSSALEGNTYSLLDTELLLTEGVKAKNKTNFETQMVLNHKAALEFIVEHPDLFTEEISFATIEEIHRHISDNLQIAPGIRKRIVKISASNYHPLVQPAKLQESTETALSIISRQTNPLRKALLALALVPYLQPFEDGNKRMGRMLANAILIHSVGRGISLRTTDAKQLALAYLSFYEFNSLQALAAILKAELSS